MKSAFPTKAALVLAALLTVCAMAMMWLYPPALEAFVARWGENAARRAAALARAGRLDEAEAALRQAAERRKAWIDDAGRPYERVYYHKDSVWVDERDFTEAARAFLEAKRPEAARLAAWEAIWRYHAVNCAGEIPEPWQALAEASRVLGDNDTARNSTQIADAASSQTPLQLTSERTNESSAVDTSIETSGTNRAKTEIPVSAFRVDPDGRFNPTNRFKVSGDALLFDEPCVAVADLPANGPSVTQLRFEARGQRAYGWPPILVAQLGGQTRLAIIASQDWETYELSFPAAIAGESRAPTAQASASLRIAYLNHGAEIAGPRVSRRSLELRHTDLR